MFLLKILGSGRRSSVCSSCQKEIKVCSAGIVIMCKCTLHFECEVAVGLTVCIYVYLYQRSVRLQRHRLSYHCMSDCHIIRNANHELEGSSPCICTESPVRKKTQKHVDVLCMFLCVGVFTET